MILTDPNIPRLHAFFKCRSCFLIFSLKKNYRSFIHVASITPKQTKDMLNKITRCVRRPFITSFSGSSNREKFNFVNTFFKFILTSISSINLN